MAAPINQTLRAKNLCRNALNRLTFDRYILVVRQETASKALQEALSPWI